jgi:serine/threonine protein phosphatase PrpC
MAVATSASRFQDTQLDLAIHPNIDELAAKYFGEKAISVHAEFGGLSHPGLIRENNEDHYSVVRRYRGRDVLLTNMPTGQYRDPGDEAFALAVADGIGGAAFGEVASMLALQTSWELTGKAFKWNFNPSEAELVEMEEAVKIYLQLIHRRIKEEAKAQGGGEGMGTTFTGALTMGWDAFIAHVGDSRAYLYRHGELNRLTRDQTLAELMVSVGLIASIDEAAKRFRNTLVSCLGGSLNDIEVATVHVVLQEGDQLLLCTDGLTDMVSEEQIGHILGHAGKPQSLCQELVDAALAGGGRDNVTVVLGRFTTT